jgi:hypothetical protein
MVFKLQQVSIVDFSHVSELAGMRFEMPPVR